MTNYSENFLDLRKFWLSRVFPGKKIKRKHARGATVHCTHSVRLIMIENYSNLKIRWGKKEFWSIDDSKCAVGGREDPGDWGATREMQEKRGLKVRSIDGGTCHKHTTKKQSPARYRAIVTIGVVATPKYSVKLVQFTHARGIWSDDCKPHHQRNNHASVPPGRRFDAETILIHFKVCHRFICPILWWRSIEKDSTLSIIF